MTHPPARTDLAARARSSDDVTVAAAQTSLYEVMEPVTAVDQNLGVEAALDAMVARGVRSMTVVDADGKPVGILSHGDVLRERARRPATFDKARVLDAMTPIVHTLPEEARFAHAIALMAIEGVHQIPVVTEQGKLLGEVSSSQALRWIARHMGYVL